MNALLLESSFLMGLDFDFKQMTNGRKFANTPNGLCKKISYRQDFDFGSRCAQWYRIGNYQFR